MGRTRASPAPSSKRPMAPKQRTRERSHNSKRTMTRTKDEVLTAFGEQVNMSADQLEEWLQTPESQQAGQVKAGDSESVGHHSGRRIVEILRKQQRGEALTDEDVSHCAKVTGYIARHTAQRPHKTAEQLEHTKWTSSLRNWGHDPLSPPDISEEQQRERD